MHLFADNFDDTTVDDHPIPPIHERYIRVKARQKNPDEVRGVLGQREMTTSALRHVLMQM